MVIIWFYIRDFFIMIGDLLHHIGELIVSLVRLVLAYGEVAIDIVGVLPSVFIVVGTVSIIIAVLFKVINRNSKEEG